MTTVIVDCGGCQVRGSACNDCVISTLLGVPGAGEPPVLADDERRALGLFAASGLLPPLRLVTHGLTRPSGAARQPEKRPQYG